MIDFKIIDFTVDYLDSALELFKKGYERERKLIPFLPEFSDTGDKTGELQWFAGDKLGFAAVREGENGNELLGYFCFYPPFKGVYNTETEYGSWSPLHAHGIKEMDTVDMKKVWERLVQAAMKRAVKEGSTYNSVTLFRHETSFMETLYMYGFGNRCADSMLDVSEYKKSDVMEKNPGFSVRQTTSDDFLRLRELRLSLSHHLFESPCFCIHNDNQFEEYIKNRETDDELVTLGLYNPDDLLIGFIDTTEGDAENFVSSGSTILNISGMFVAPEYRGGGLARLLVDAAVEEARNLGKKVLGVDYETMNPTARGFWEKYFTPYTLSGVRHFDFSHRD